MLKRILIGMLIFPFLPMATVDLMFFQRGLNAFDSYAEVTALVTEVYFGSVNIRRSKSGSQGAIYETILTPRVKYKYSWNEQQMRGERVFLFDVEDTSAIDPRAYCEKSSPNPCLSELKQGLQIVAWVNKKQPSESYIYRGTPILWTAIYFWIKVYVIFSIFVALSISLIAFAKINRDNRNR